MLRKSGFLWIEEKVNHRMQEENILKDVFSFSNKSDKLSPSELLRIQPTLGSFPKKNYVH